MLMQLSRLTMRGEGPCLDTLAAGCSSLHEFAEALGNAVDARDAATYNHSQEVAEIAQMLACAMGLSREEVMAIHVAGHLHDIGKIGIPDSVLKKKGSLNDLEWLWMRRHPEIGSRILAPVKAFGGEGGVTHIMLCHHERYDGGGYPQGLKGDGIPVGARIIAVADTLSALLQERPYRKGTSFGAALAEIERCAGSQFDPIVVSVLETVRERIGLIFNAK